MADATTPSTPASKIGPTFGAELAAAGCRLDFSWDSVAGVLSFPPALNFDGTANLGAFSSADIAKVEAVLAAHNPAKVAVPQSVTNYQAKHALILAGVCADVDKALRAADQTVQGNQIALAAWDYANYFLRSDPLIAAMAGVLKLDSDQIDQLFIEAQAF